MMWGLGCLFIQFLGTWTITVQDQVLHLNQGPVACLELFIKRSIILLQCFALELEATYVVSLALRIAMNATQHLFPPLINLQ